MKKYFSRKIVQKISKIFFHETNFEKCQEKKESTSLGIFRIFKLWDFYIPFIEHSDKSVPS